MADAVALREPTLLRPKRAARWPAILPAASILALLVITIWAYACFLGIGFVATDSLPLIATSRLTSLADAWALFQRPLMAGTPFADGEVVYRPFVSVMFGLDYAVWGLNPLGYHLTNLVLHLVSVVMVWWLLALFRLRWWSALIGAAVFALHPLVVVSIPIIARRDSIAPVTAFTVAWVLLLLAERSAGRKRAVAVLISLVLAAVALLSKESAFVAVGMLPVLVAGRAYADGATWRAALARCRVVVPYFVLAAVLFVIRFKVLGGLGGSVENPNEKIIWDRYTQALGAYTRDLTWSFSELAASPREVWPILAGLLLVGFGIGSLCLPRRQAVVALMGLAWLLAFAVFAMAFRIATVAWLAYFALPGAALLWAAGCEGAVQRLRQAFANPGPLWLPQLSSAALLLVLGALGVSWVATSSLFRPYTQWQFAGDISRQYVEALTQCAAASSQTHVRLEGMPSSLDDGQADTGQLGVTLFEGYTIEAALRLWFPQQNHTLTVWSRETLRDTDQHMTLACIPDPTRVYLIATY